MTPTHPGQPDESEVEASLGDGYSSVSPAEESNLNSESDYLSDRERRAASRSFGWTVLADLLRARRFLIAVAILSFVSSVAISLALPVYYSATATVLPPETSGQGGLGALLGGLSPVASKVLGGSGSVNDYTRYMAILHSREMLDAVVRRFDLVNVYEHQDKRYPEYEARRTLVSNLNIEVDLEYEFLGVSVLDRSPQRAAQIANFMVLELNRRNSELGVENARRFREYVQHRYESIELALDSARQDMQAFQERYGVIELPSTAQALIESAVAQRSVIAEAEMRYQALLSQYGPDNPDVEAAGEALASARRSQQGLLEGREQLMPVPLQRLPAVAGEYARVYQEMLIQQALLETARPLYEQARFDEERDRTAVQVLDPARPPERKAEPKRGVIVVVITLSSIILAAMFSVGAGWLRRNRSTLARALQAAQS